ncbi:MAG TPA: hypothetical protein VIK92_07765 [Thermaerobacter sp.]
MAQLRGAPAVRVASASLVAGLAQIATVYALQPLLGTDRGLFSRFVAAALRLDDGATVAAPVVSIAGVAILLVAAVLWGFLFRAVAPAGNALTGVLYGLAIWLIGALVVLPLLDALAGGGPGPGFLGTGFSGARSAFVAAAAHGVYGGLLGAMLGGFEDRR